MAHLTLAGASDDGRRLTLVDDEGTQFTLDVTPALRTAVSTPSRLGQLEKQMDSVLRPRDIQARIRAGESPEAVAEAAQTSIDKIMVYAGPVLAEREHVAQRAQRSSVRRSSGESGARTLGEAVATHLRSLNIDPAGVEWDAWRREDGRWTLTGRFSTPAREGTATYVFDAPGNYVVLDDEDARWLIGEVIAAPPGVPPMRDDLHERRRLLSSVPGHEPAATSCRWATTRSSWSPSRTTSPSKAPWRPPTPRSRPSSTTPPPPTTRRCGRRPPRQPPTSRASPRPRPPTAATAATRTPSPAPDDGEAEPPQRRTVQKKRGRASVPSWDEIMFGGGDQ